MVKFRFVVLVIACLGLSGCASLQLMSWGASGISYMVTGKSISDHAISTVMKKDCALHRTILGENTCVEHDGNGVIRGVKPSEHPVIAKEDNWQIIEKPLNQSINPIFISERRQLPPMNQPQSSTPKPTQLTVSPNQTVLELMAEQKHQVKAEYGDNKIAKRASYLDKPALYAVVGSYNNKHFAQSNIIKQAQRSNVKARLMVNSVESINQGAPKYRVLIGPLNANQFDTNLGDVGESANYEAWRMTLCQQTLLPPPCDSNMLVANRH